MEHIFELCPYDLLQLFTSEKVYSAPPANAPSMPPPITDRVIGFLISVPTVVAILYPITPPVTEPAAAA